MVGGVLSGVGYGAAISPPQNDPRRGGPFASGRWDRLASLRRTSASLRLRTLILVSIVGSIPPGPSKKPARRGAGFFDGGEGGIRTHDRVTPMPHFECGAFDHSATSP